MKRTLWATLFLTVLLLTAGAAAEEEWQYVIDDQQAVTLTAYLGNDTSVIVPQRIADLPVVGLGTGALPDSIHDVTLNALMTELAEGAFPRSAVIHAPHGSAALAYASRHGLASVNTSKLDFAEGVIDLTGAFSGCTQRGNRFIFLNAYRRIISEGGLFYVPDKGMGCVYEVLSVAEGDGTFTADTRQAAADLSYETFSVHMQDLMPDYEHLTLLTDMVSNIRYDRIPNNTALSIDQGTVRLRSASNTPVLSAKTINFDFTLPLGNASKASFGISLDLSLAEFEVRLTGHFGKIESAKMLVNAATSVSLSASTDASFGSDADTLLDLNSNLLGGSKLSLSEGSSTSGMTAVGEEKTVELMRIPFMTTGGFTLSVVPKLTVSVDGHISVSIDSCVDAGFLYDGEWHSLCQVNEPELNLEAAAGLKARFDLAFTASLPMVPDVAELALTLLEVDAKAKAASTTTTQATRACIDLSLDLRCKITVGIGLKNAIAKYKKWLKSDMEVPDLWLSFTLFNRSVYSRSLHYEPLLGVVEHCTKGGVKVVFDANGGEGGMEIYALPGYAAAPTVTREGYSFVCWLNENGEETWSFDVQDQERRFYAKWAPIEGYVPEQIETYSPEYHSFGGYSYYTGPNNELAGLPYGENGLLLYVMPNVPDPYAFYTARLATAQEDYYGNYGVEPIENADGSISGGIGLTASGYRAFTRGDYWMAGRAVTIVGGPANLRNSSLTSIVYGPAFISTVGNAYCENLQSVTFSDGIQAIGSYRDCVSLRSISIPDSVSSLDSGAFMNCVSLSSAKLPSGLAKIPGSLFQNCSSLLSVSVPVSVTEIQDNAFDGCVSLASVTIPAGVKSIGARAFADCAALRSITLPAGLESLHASAFDGCASLEEITLPAGIHIWPDFKGCVSLKRIRFASAAQFEDAEIALDFNRYPSLEGLDLSARKLNVYGIAMLSSCETLSLHASEDIYIDSAKGQHGPAVLSLTAGGRIDMLYGVMIGNLRELNIDADTICMEIGTLAETLTVNDRAAGLDKSRFCLSNCPNLTQLYVQEYGSVQGDGFDSWIQGCPALEEVHIGSAYVISRTFYDCSALKTVMIDHMTGAFKYCFVDSPSVETLIIGEGCTAVTQPFMDKTSALHLVVPESVQQIDLGEPADYPNRLVLEAPEGSTAALMCPEFLLGPYRLAFLSEYGTEAKTLRNLAAGARVTLPARDELSSVAQGLEIWSHTWYTDAACTIPAELDNWGRYVMPGHDATLYVGFVLNQPWGEEWEAGTFETPTGTESGNILRAVGTGIAIYKLNEYNPCECIGIDLFGDTVRTVVIPPSLRGVEPGAFRSAAGLERIVVQPGSEHFYSRDGALYDSSDTLLAVPHALYSYEFEIPDGTKGIADYAFGWVECPSELRAIIVPDSVTRIGAHAFDGLSADTMIICSRTSAAYTAASSASLLAHPSSVVYMVGNECWGYYMVPAGSALPQIAAPQTAGEVFMGWSTARQGAVIDNTYLVPEGGIVLYAVWQGNGIPVNEDYFPDPAFRAYVSENYDMNGDGSLSEDERNSAEFMRVSVQDEEIPDACSAQEAAYIWQNYQSQIRSLKGIEYLTGLRWLYAAEMEKMSGTLNLSQNRFLEHVSVLNSNLTGLNVSGCNLLRFLDCKFNAIKALDVSTLTNLEWLWSAGNRLTTLDVTRNAKLLGLGCETNQLTELDVSHNTLLTGLWAHENRLTAIDVTHNPELETLNVWDNQLTSIDLSRNAKLTGLYVEWNQLTALDVGHLTHLVELECMDNRISSLDVSRMTELVQLYCNMNQLTELDVSNCTKLERLTCNRNELTELNVSNCTKLDFLVCNDNRLTTLDLSRNPNLSVAYADNNNISSVTLSSNLECLSIFGNPLSVLNISNCQKLISAVRNGEPQQEDDHIGYVYEQAPNDWYWLFCSMETILIDGNEASTVLQLPVPLREIEEEAFAGIAADIVVVPAGCISVGSRAFANCPNLKTVYIPSSASVASDVFVGCGNVQVIRTE